MAERTVLVIDDEPGHRLMLGAVLTDKGWRVEEAGGGREGLARLLSVNPDVVLLDMRMPDMDGSAVLAEIMAQRPGLPVIMLTAFGSVGAAVEAMKHGAHDYLTKPVDNDELAAVLERAYDFARLVRENALLREGRSEGPVLVGQSPSMDRLREVIAQVGPAEATVLIQGESGTGKELVAEMLHQASHRSRGPLVRVNCAALPGDLLESELFGYVKGAFTGAVSNKPGRFQLADGGTIFLDEVGELPQALQAKLLRALQERVIEPLGGVKPVPVDVRILAATNRDLKAEAQAGRFREDLYYRLAVLELTIPPLRERPDDIPLLAAHLLRKLGEKNRKQVREPSPAFLDALLSWNWPGNVRELENVLERALILARADTLTPDLLPPQIVRAWGGLGEAAPDQGRTRKDVGADRPSGGGLASLRELGARGSGSLDDVEREAIERALAVHGGHREKTAEALGISRRTLQYKLKKYGLLRR
ncbi:two component, sigma54 specific, transcriptional regulator, Fis family [Alkalidesulfovibrio alkalitolerans DSM 16529]|jgi:DNA-binding NtrC family response regulator|uniref:Two component, sigma54 specific, transcriptional regulator, Fis family n=1 Tax=Alkalidesulfovibrio alkalitolerans DSM 16529 TaxID=1121439 RepID=S7T7Q7_9BACT|nr:sigma-54 dependent transcriptional regulator [Alkalidesulfovibrio alkalitolerans]EPR33162.1 two component, sigma54 specific, transcriptional regulator, Fis family [Alkalidesulfovibrio alkalitolerans DSM 16529]